MDDDRSESLGNAQQLAFIRDETRFEIGLLHDRVNALVGAEAFLTIAFTAAMSNGAPWGVRFSLLVSPILSLLGLSLALLAWPGVAATVKIILQWTARYDELVERSPALNTAVAETQTGMPDQRNRRVGPDQRRSMLFFRAVPGLFTLVWVALTVIALAIRR